MIDKETEVVQFFIDLLIVYMQVLPASDTEFFDNAISFVKFYFDTYHSTQFLDEPTICCPILNLICLLYDRVNEKDSPVGQLLHQAVLDKYLFTHDSLHMFLDSNCKSMFVRKSFKQLLKKHLSRLVVLSFGGALEPRLDRLMQILSIQLPLDVRIHNFDIYSELMQQFLFEENRMVDMKTFNRFHSFHQSFHYDLNDLNQLLNCECLRNDASIESLAFIVFFDLLMQFVAIEQENPFKSVFDLDQVFLARIEQVCQHFISAQQQLHDSHSISKFKKNTDLLFKFLIYFYSMLGSFMTRSGHNLSGFMVNSLVGLADKFDKLKYKTEFCV